MRDLSDDVNIEKNKNYNQPVELLRVFLDQETLYLARYQQDIQFFDEEGNTQTYRSFNWERGKVNTNTDTKVNSVDVSVANVSKEMSAYVANNDFKGRRLQIVKVFLNAKDNPKDEIIVFDGKMSAPSVNEQEISVKITDRLDTLDRQLPKRTFSRRCNWTFGGEECGVTIPAKSSTIDSISSDHLTINDDAITENADYWKYGIITVGDEKRLVSESGSGYVKVEYPFLESVASGDNYDLEAGCDKTIGNDYKEGKIDNIDGNKLEDSDITEIADYWKNGKVIVGNEKMRIIESGSGYVKAEYDFDDAEADDDYKIEAEIDTSKNIAHGCLFWDNFNFFGGFANVPKIEDIRRVD